MQSRGAASAELRKILEELSAREPLFHRAEFGTTRADFERMTAEDFRETGASGRQYTRTVVLDVLADRYSSAHNDSWEAQDFQLMQLGPETYLLTYTLLQFSHRLTRRATIWKRTSEGWKALYHQGTIVQNA
jgi:hypothetical protein